MDDIARRVIAVGSCPEDLTEDLAVKELGKGANLYDQAADNYNLAEFNIDKIKILKRKLDPAMARELAPPEVQGFLDRFDTLIQRPVDELQALSSSGTLVEPYWDPKLKKSLNARKQLYTALFNSNLLTFVRRRKARVGFFTVRKKDDWIRLILDARQSNACHRTPPQAKLGTPAGLASIDLSHRTLESRGFSFVDDDDGLPTAVTGDVGDCFYNFVIPAASEWFCADDVFSLEEIHAMGVHISRVFDSSQGGWTAAQPGEKLYPAFYGMPLGWSWSLWIANEIVNRQCVHHLSGSQDSLVRDKHPPPQVQQGSPAIGVYVDNVVVIWGNQADSMTIMGKIADRFESLNIPFEVDQQQREQLVEVLGLEFSMGTDVLVSNKRRRIWRVWLAVSAVLRRKRVHGKFIQILPGHINHIFQLCRPALSALSACYRFVADHSHHRYPL